MTETYNRFEDLQNAWFEAMSFDRTIFQDFDTDDITARA